MSTDTNRYNDDVTCPTKALLPVNSSATLLTASTSTRRPLIPQTAFPKLQKSASLRDFFKKTSTEKKSVPTPSHSRTKIADLVQKHLLPLNIISSFKANRRNQNTTISCPKLPAKADDSECCSEKENLTEVEYLSIPIFTHHQPNSQTPKAFSKTDILFTTSFTHSADRSEDLQSDNSDKSDGLRLARNKSKSAQNLNKIPRLGAAKQVLTRSYSDVPPSSITALDRSNSNLSVRLQSRMYHNDHVSQLLDHLFIGSVEAAYNEPLLCKLKIDCLLDISNCLATDVPSSKKLHCPCMCPEENRHFRSRLIIQVEDKDSEDIESYFPEINKFIVAARHRGKRVLVFSYLGKSRSATAAIQYMMSQENFLLRQAFHLVKNQRPSVDIKPAFMAKLETLERNLFPDAKPSISFGNEYLNIADPQAIRCAWVDCADI